MSQKLQQFFQTIHTAEDELETEFDALYTENDVLREALGTSQKSLREQSQIVTDLKADQQQLLSQRTNLSTVVEQYREANENQVAALRDLNQEVAQLSSALETARAANTQLNMVINRVRGEAHDAEARRGNMLVALNDKSQELSQITNELQAKSFQLVEAENKVRIQGEARDDFEKELILYSIRHTMYQYGTVPPEGQAERIAEDVYRERENIRNIMLARSARR